MPDSDSDSGDEKSSSSSSRTLNDSVYGGWKGDTQIALEGKRLLTYVTGERRQPTPWSGVGGASDAASAAAREKAEDKILEWKEKDGQAKSIIARRLPHDHRHLVTAATTSKALWDSIVKKYESNRSGASIAATVIEVANKRWVDGSLEKHISWFRETNQLLARFESPDPDNPTECNHFPQRILSCLLVNSIPSTGDWGAVKASIFANNMFQSSKSSQFELVAAQLMGEAHRLRLDESSRQTPANPSTALYSSGQSALSTAPKQTDSPSDERNGRPFCTHCRNLGHKKDTCWKLHPDLAPEHKPRRQRSSRSRKDGKESSNKASSKEGKRASRAQYDSDEESSDGQGSPPPRRRDRSPDGWSHCAVTAENDEDGDCEAPRQVATAIPPSVSGRASVSLRASESPVEEKVSIHSVGIRGKSLVTDWLVDSGASLHYCHQREMFDAFESITGKGKSVILGDGRRIPVSGYGTLKVSVPVFGGLIATSLTNVQYTPDMAVNLLSVSCLTETGLEVRFVDRECTIRRGRKVVARAYKVANRLFQLTVAKRTAQSGKSQDNSAHVAQLDVAQLWHQRLGHLNFASLKKLFAEELVREEQGVDCERISRALRDVSKCESCALAKSTRKPFPVNDATRALKPLELIHMDLCTMPQRSKDNAKHFLTIQDDSTRECWVFLLTTKDEALPKYKAWVTAAEAEHSAAGHKVLAVRSDNGGEFISGEFDTLLKERGSHRERSAAYTPEQNGVAERLNRTLLNSVRAMLHDSQLDGTFWDEALLTAAYIHNRVPTRALNGKTPHEAWSGRKPRVLHLRVFGSLAFAHVPKKGRSKLASRATRCVLLGYQPDAKAYRLWDIAAKAVIVSRDVDFWEGASCGNETAGRGGAAPVAPETKLTGLSSSSNRRTNPRRAVRGSVDSTESDTASPDSESDGSDSEVEPATPEPSSPEPLADRHESDEKEPAEETKQPAAAQPRRKRIAKGEPGYLPRDLAGLRDRNAPAAKDVAPSLVPPRALATATCDDVEQDPRSYREAMRGPNAREWRDECESEIDQQRKMGTYKLVPRPKQRVNIVDNKWVFHSKYNAQGELIKRRARLVAKGYSQRPGVDYFETYSPVVRYPSLRGLLSLAAQHDWEVHHMDVKAAYLNGDLQETVYMRQPEGFEVQGKEDWVCLLEKGLYGLKQAGRVWNQKADKFLRQLKFTPLDADRCVYVWEREGRMVVVALYVDDMFLFAPRGSNLLAKLKARLQQKFEMTDLGEVSEALGVEIARNRKARTLTITQRRHVRGILERAGMTDCAAATTPLAVGTQLCRPEEDYKATAADTLRYQKAMGELNYLVVWTRPDIAFAVSALSKYCSNPSPSHFSALRHLYRYLRGTQGHGITYRGAGDVAVAPTLTIYSDSDFAACIDDRRSVTGYSVHLGGAVVSWLSTRQGTTAQSTVEAEYMSSAEAVKEAVWWRAFLRGLGHRLHSPTVLYSDNQGSIALSKNPDSHRRTKHIDVKYHLLREHVEKGTVTVQYISTKEMPADVLTKGLPPLKHRHCAGLLGIGA
jgi:transposase InsO family protein